MKSVMFIFAAALFLEGCASSKDLECPKGVGLPCHSLGRVSDHLDSQDALHDPTQVYVVLERI